MRYSFRLTRTIALTVFVCVLVFLYASGRGPASFTEHIRYKPSDTKSNHDPSKLESISNPVSFDSIQSLWAYWSKVFYDDRPQTKPISLSNNANVVSIPDKPGLREPPLNRVLNPESEIDSLRASHAAFLAAIQSAEAGEVFNGTGVVIVGGGEYFGPAIIGLQMLRKTGSTLRVEIFVADMTEYEPKICEDYLPKFGARCLVLSRFLEEGNTLPTFKVTHYQLKALAMLFSSFAEVLYLDSDSIPLVNPSTELFSAEPYNSSGLVIWPDFWLSTESPLFYTIAGMSAFPSDLPKSSSEAGQLMINKRTHFKTLLLATYYNIYGPDYFYPLLSQGALGQGDKETFMAAALAAGQSYYRVMTGVNALGRHSGHEYKGSGMIQYHPHDDLLQAVKSTGRGRNETQVDVRPAFLHANTPKMNAGHLIDEGDLFAPDKKRLRLWGTSEDQEKRFGYDLEKTVWELLLKSGCELEHVIKEWKSRKRMCGRLQEHWEEVFLSSR